MLTYTEYNKIEKFLIAEINKKLKNQYNRFYGLDINADCSDVAVFSNDPADRSIILDDDKVDFDYVKVVTNVALYADLQMINDPLELSGVLKNISEAVYHLYGVKGYVLTGAMVLSGDGYAYQNRNLYSSRATPSSLLLIFDFSIEKLMEMKEYKNALQKVENIKNSEKCIKTFNL